MSKGHLFLRIPCVCVCALCNLLLPSIGYGPTHVCFMSIRLHLCKYFEVGAQREVLELVGALVFLGGVHGLKLHVGALSLVNFFPWISFFYYFYLFVASGTSFGSIVSI